MALIIVRIKIIKILVLENKLILVLNERKEKKKVKKNCSISEIF